MNLCVNCKFFVTPGQNCSHSNNTNPVTGAPTTYDAWKMRNDQSLCGREGRWFVKDTGNLTSAATPPSAAP